MKKVEVAVGVIKRDDHIFVCLRGEDQHQGGLWEFPGGKREPQETIEQALHRELLEEIGIYTEHSVPLITIEHDYGDKLVCLDVHLVDQFSGEPKGMEGQPSQWVAIEDLHTLAFPKANQAIVSKLQQQFGV